MYSGHVVTMTGKVEIRRAARLEMPVIGNLLQLYLYEFSTSENTDVDTDGRFAWPGLNEYWDGDDLHPFLIRVDGRLAGFALVQRYSVVARTPTAWDMEDFFILQKYRRKSIGSYAARHLLGQFSGSWEIRVRDGNDPAFQFWKSLITTQCGHVPASHSIATNGRGFTLFQFETP